MKNTLFTCLALVVVIAVSSCRKKDNPRQYTTADSIMMRYNGGYSAQPEVRTYLLANGTAQADTTYPANGIYDIDFGQDKYDQVAYVLNEIPAALLNNNGKNYSSDKYPDAAGMQVTTSIKGVAYSWYFSSYTNDQPEYARVFADKLFGARQTLEN